MYKRQIAYFDLIEFEEKRGSAGFCKWEQKEGVHTLQITLNGLKRVENKKVKIFTREEDELGEVAIRNGAASFLVEKREEDVDWEWEFSEIHIPLSEGCELVAGFEVIERRILKKKEKMPSQLYSEEIEKDKEQMEVLSLEKVNVEEVNVEKTNLQGILVGDKMAPEETKLSDESVAEEMKLPDEREAEMSNRVGVMPEEKEYLQQVDAEAIQQEVEGMKEREEEKTENAENEIKGEVPLYSLWDCLIKTHELIHPFGTEIQYCKIGMGEILLLKEKYHLLRKNQFLLHGYYNYKYLIIGKKDGAGEKYWLGVPGIYHEREKMAARMYGFEKFEGKRPSYRVGDLGFYLITVE